mgnify:FL=1
MAMKKEHPDFYLRLAQLTMALNEGLRKTHRSSVFAEMDDATKQKICLSDVADYLKRADEALAILRKG